MFASILFSIDSGDDEKFRSLCYKIHISEAPVDLQCNEACSPFHIQSFLPPQELLQLSEPVSVFSLVTGGV